MIIQIIITLVAVFITTYLNHRYSTSREDKNWNRTFKLMKIQEFNKASATFRAEFTDEICLLRPNGTDSRHVLDCAIGRHERAMIIFRSNLPIDILGNFDAAWREYACPHKDNPDYVDIEMYFSNEKSEREKFRKLAIQRIEKLLEYAKPM